MKARTVTTLLLSALLCLSLAACGGGKPAPSGSSGPEGSGQPQDKTVLSVGVTIAKNTPAGQALLACRDDLEARSDGTVTLDIYWESIMGGASELAESVMTGTMDMALVSSAIISNYTPAIDVLSLPFIISDRDQVKAVVDTCFDEVTAGMEDTIGIPLGIWEFGWRHLCTRDTPVYRLEDCQGLSIRVMDGKVYSDTFNALGCIPQNIAVSELVTALQQGVVDGAEEPLATVCNQQQYTFCKYITMLAYNYSACIPVLSADTAAALPEDTLALVRQVFWDHRYDTADSGAAFEEEYISQCEANGMTVIRPDSDELARFQAAVRPVWDRYADKIGAELIEKVANARG